MSFKKFKETLTEKKVEVNGVFVTKIFLYGMITGAVLMWLFAILGIVG